MALDLKIANLSNNDIAVSATLVLLTVYYNTEGVQQLLDQNQTYVPKVYNYFSLRDKPRRSQIMLVTISWQTTVTRDIKLADWLATNPTIEDFSEAGPPELFSAEN
ncbi:hypothetical protein EMCG_00567 [[Emmonsia] crescens]|uniref:Uncharacterized protein n=1 Tax=[Emmonsia] crescens TaxID=73230 RepID=A0A0G2IZM3_9EURO|nr:hypothetical protein EMCG_00567 [Emmonsia crescens UAMH 3008]